MIEDPKLLETVKEALEMFRPQLQADGGDMEFVCIDDDYKVHLNLTGACGGCPSSMPGTAEAGQAADSRAGTRRTPSRGRIRVRHRTDRRIP